MEPYRLKKWKVQSTSKTFTFYTSGRPGRSKGEGGVVQDRVVHTWVDNLPPSVDAVVSLLGRKNGMSEFDFYSFSGGFDEDAESRRGPSLQEWLDRHHPARNIVVVEHPTEDFQEIPDDILEAITKDVVRLASDGRTVIVVDSGGVTRTRQVADHLGAKETTGQL